MQKFKTIREAMTMSPYAIGMAQAKKMYGYGKGPATDLPKNVIKKAHDIAKRVKANESFDDIVEEILQEETPQYSDAYPDPSSYGHQELKNAHKLYKGLKSKGTKDVAYTMRLAQELEKRKKAESVDLTDKNEKEKGVAYKGMGTDVVNKKKKLNPTIPLTQKDRQVKDYMEEVEDLDELSKKTLSTYAMKASTDAVKNQRKQSNYQRVGDDDDEAPGTQKLYTRMANKAGEQKVKRLSGIATALSKLAKEEVEDLDEVSKKLLHSYVNKAAFNVASNAHAVASAGSSIPKIQKPLDQLNKRLRGIDKAAGKMAKEEVEEIDELSKATLGSYVKKAHQQALNLQRKQTNYERIANDDDETPIGQKVYTHMAKKADVKRATRTIGLQKAVAKLTKEEVLDELSKKTLNSYIDKAKHQADWAVSMKPIVRNDANLSKQADNMIKKRETGIGNAINKKLNKQYTNEEVEEIDELSKKTLGSYVNKAVTSVHNLGYNAGSKMSSGDVNTGMKSAINSIKRQTNINTAVKKLAKEEAKMPKDKPISSSQAMANHAKYFDKVVKLDPKTGKPMKEAKEEMPTGIKIYHKNKDTGKEGFAIQFTVKNAQAHIKDLVKDGHKVTGKALMFGTKEGPRKAMSEEKLDELKKSTYGDYINTASRRLRASASIRKDFERDADQDVNRAYKKGIDPDEKERHLKNYEVNKGLAADFAKDSEKRIKGISRATKKLTK